MSVTDHFEERLLEWQDALKIKLERAPFPREPGYLYEPIRYALESKGKRLRPAFVFAGTEAVGGEWRNALNAAAAVEVFHLFTLVHDDIMDHDTMRRGRPAVHSAFDLNRALLGGDALLIYAYRLLTQLPENILKRAFEAFNKYGFAVCEGQAWDMQFENQKHIEVSDYDKMIDAKTGALLNLSAYLGGLVGGGSEEQSIALGEIALLTGRAFQMQDDLLEVTSSSATMGKSLGSDILNEKKTWLWIDLWYHLPASASEEWASVKANQDLSDEARVALVREWMNSTGTIDRASHRIQQWLDTANERINLSGFQNPESLKALLILILHRKS